MSDIKCERCGVRIPLKLLSLHDCHLCAQPFIEEARLFSNRIYTLEDQLERQAKALEVMREALEKMAPDWDDGGAEGYYGGVAREALRRAEEILR